MKTPATDILDELAAALAAINPQRQVSRRWKDRSNYRMEDRQNGIHTLLYRGEGRNPDIYNSTLRLLVIGHVEVPQRDTTGEDVETAEQALIAELKALNESDAGALLTINSIVTSMQIEHPNGWYVAECSYGPVDLSVADSRWEDDTRITTVFAGLDPEIGIDHEDDYINVEGGDHAAGA